MASILSLVLAALVAGTIFNLVDEWNYGLKPFRPIDSLITEAPEWFGIYCLAGAVGGASLLLNVWLDSWLCVLLVTAVAFAISLWMICTEPGITHQELRGVGQGGGQGHRGLDSPGVLLFGPHPGLLELDWGLSSWLPRSDVVGATLTTSRVTAVSSSFVEHAVVSPSLASRPAMVVPWAFAPATWMMRYQFGWLPRRLQSRCRRGPTA